MYICTWVQSLRLSHKLEYINASSNPWYVLYGKRERSRGNRLQINDDPQYAYVCLRMPLHNWI